MEAGELTSDCGLQECFTENVRGEAVWVAYSPSSKGMEPWRHDWKMDLTRRQRMWCSMRLSVRMICAWMPRKGIWISPCQRGKDMQETNIHSGGYTENAFKDYRLGDPGWLSQ